MTIEELNTLIAEELKAYLNENEEEAPEADGDDDIEVTTDEPAVADTGEEAMDLLRQIYDMIKPEVEPEGGEEPEMDMDMGDEEEGEAEDGEEEEDEELDEEVLNELVGQYGADPVSPIFFLVGAIGLPLTAFLLLSKEDKKEVIDRLKSKVGDIKALAKMSKGALKALAQDIGLIKGDSMEEAVDNHTFFRGDNVGRTVVKAKDVQGTREKATLKEGFDGADRFQKLANIKK